MRCDVTQKDWAGIPIDAYPYLTSWLHKMLERPGVEKGRHVPSHHGAFDAKNLSEEEKEKHAKETSKWILQGNTHTAGTEGK